MHYDVIIIGAGPGGIFSAYELNRLDPNLNILVLEKGKPLEKRSKRGTQPSGQRKQRAGCSAEKNRTGSE